MSFWCNRNMGNEYYQPLKSRKQRTAPDPLLRELSVLSRAPSLRDPSSSAWKPSKSTHKREEKRDTIPEEGEEQGEEQTGERTGWQDKVASWIDGGLREGERKQELLRSISELLNTKPEPPTPPPQPERTTGVPKHRKTGTRRRPARIGWRDKEEPETTQYFDKALAVRRHEQDYSSSDSDSDSDSSSSPDETYDVLSHSRSPLLGNDRKMRRPGKTATCGSFSFPYKSREPDGTQTNHGCGLPWSYWSKHKGKSLVELAGRSLSCAGGYAEIPRRKITGQEIVPAPSESRYEHELSRRRHRSLSQKYRPKTFKEIVGQNIVAQALGNAVNRGRVAPVYLFHGPRGTGKTTAARILAGALICNSLEESRPCGVCRECLLLFLGKSTDVREVDVSGDDMKKLLSQVAVPPSCGIYKVFIVDECHTLAPDGWKMFLKCLEEPPDYAVFILITTDAEQLPHLATSRCQKFHFPKLKDSDIVTRLHKIVVKENMEVDMDALELIAGRSNGSMRDAETTLEQLGLVGQKITLQVVQELVGMVSNGKLAELLDMALIGDTLNTVKCIREFMDAGVEPLALMSQIATLITDILAGGYVPTSDKGFFRKRTLTKEQLEKLRQALKTLSESEKQIRSSQDQTTWLTAALLQFAPDSSQPHYALSSAETSGAPSILAANDTSEKDTVEWEPTGVKWDEFDHQHQFNTDAINNLSVNQGDTSAQEATSQYPHFQGDYSVGQETKNQYIQVQGVNTSFPARQEVKTQYLPPQPSEGERQAFERQQKLTETWVRVLEVSQSNMLKHLLWNHSKLLSISIEGGRAVADLEFEHIEHKSMAERSKTSISHAFQLVLGFPVEIRFHLTGENETKTVQLGPPSPAKMGSVPQAEYLNSRSFPVFTGRVKGADGGDEFCHDGLEGNTSLKTCSSHSDPEVKICPLHNERQMFQAQGRRFKLKTVRNFSTDLTGDSGKQPEVKNQKSAASKQKHGSLLCWKANKVDEDDAEMDEEQA